MTPTEINKRVLALDMNNLTVEELDWLHELKNRAQKIRIAEFYKSQGMDNMRSRS
jgi:hypothetical protein